MLTLRRYGTGEGRAQVSSERAPPSASPPGEPPPARSVWDAVAPPGNPRAVAISGVFLTSGTALWWWLFAILLHEGGLSLLEIGVVIAAGTATSLLSAIAGGWIADIAGRKPVILTATLMNAVGTFFLAETVATSVLSFGLVLGVYGFVAFGGTFASGSLRALLFESSTADRRGAAMSAPYVLPSLVAIPMPFIGSLLSRAIGWPVVFLVSGALLCVSFTVYALLLEEPRGTLQRPAPRRDPRPRRWAWWMLGSPVVALFGVYSFIGFGQGICAPFMGLYFTRYLGASVPYFGLIASVEMALVGGLAWVSGRLVDRIGALPTMSASLGGEAAIVTGMVFVRNLLLAGGLYEAWSAVDWFDLTAPSVFLGTNVTTERRATVIGAFGTVTRLPTLVAPELGGYLFGIFPPLILVAYATVAATSAAFLVFLRTVFPSPPRTPLGQSTRGRDPAAATE